MLNLALKAQLPLIRAHTTDLINLDAVLEHLAPGSIRLSDMKFPTALTSPTFLNRYRGKVIYAVGVDAGILGNAYGLLANRDISLLSINPEGNPSAFFDTGELPVPTELMRSLVGSVLEEGVEEVLSALSGVTLKDAAELCRLCMAKFGKLVRNDVLSMRHVIFGAQLGLHPVDTNFGYYYAPDWMQDWFKVDGKLLTSSATPTELVPKGLLFDGPPGTGKTVGAKYLASHLGIPLYRLDIGGLLGKYVGESETNFTDALSQIQALSPCVLLIDEIEKLFQASGEDSGVTPRILSTLLWWLQERTCRAFVVMTTNAVDKIPKELYRPGRIDKLVLFGGLVQSEGQDFIRSLASRFGIAATDEALGSIESLCYSSYKVVSQATLTQAVHNLVKLRLVRGTE